MFSSVCLLFKFFPLAVSHETSFVSESPTLLFKLYNRNLVTTPYQIDLFSHKPIMIFETQDIVAPALLCPRFRQQEGVGQSHALTVYLPFGLWVFFFFLFFE